MLFHLDMTYEEIERRLKQHMNLDESDDGWLHPFRPVFTWDCDMETARHMVVTLADLGQGV